LIEKMATTDEHRTVRASAIDALSKTEKDKYKTLYEKAVFDSSYSVAGAALDALAIVDEVKAISLLSTLKKDARGRLESSVETLAVLTKGDADFDEMYGKFKNTTSLQDKFNNLEIFITYLGNVNNTDNFKKGVDEVVAFREKVAQYGVAPQINALLNSIVGKKEAAKASGKVADIQAQIDYIKEKAK
jgi:aminopeptidase N